MPEYAPEAAEGCYSGYGSEKFGPGSVGGHGNEDGESESGEVVELVQDCVDCDRTPEFTEDVMPSESDEDAGLWAFGGIWQEKVRDADNRPLFGSEWGRTEWGEPAFAR